MRKLFFFILISGIILMTPWAIISVSVSDRVYLNIDTIPTREVGVVLGTTPGIGGSNLFFTTRIEATKELYERGKIKKIIVSGDNSNKSYNEPEYMRNALVK
jgi:SanA protein